jgi:hypothetical protein
MVKSLSTLGSRLSTLFLAKSFWEPRMTRMDTDKIQDKETQGYTWASQAAMDFQIPLQAC